MKQLITIALLAFCVFASAQDKLNIVPKPAEVVMQPQVINQFVLNNSVKIFYNDVLLKKDIDYLIRSLYQNFNIKLYAFLKPVDFKKIQKAANKSITVTLLPKEYQNDKGDDYYDVNCGNSQATVTVNSAKAFFYTSQTILQLIQFDVKKKNYILPFGQIKDYPRFAYRGMHLDVARHFLPVDFVKKYIDYLAAYKFNTFHWHLTDDQGWRIEIKKYPRLTQVGGWRNGTITGRYPGKGNTNQPHGGFYTQEQIKEVIKYAADRYITIIPEIEMPGHASAAIAAYPQLSCFPDEDTKVPPDCIWSGVVKGKMVQQTWGVFEDVFAPTDYAFNFLQDVLDEVVQLFPSKYIHIGGDECPKESWKRSVFCQQLIKEKGLKDEHGLQSYFINRIEKYLNSKGRNIIGWDEILEGGLAPNATVMSWRGEEGGIEAAKQNHDVIMTPGKPVYFDHSQSKNEDSVTIGGYNSLEAVYAYDPIPKVLNEKQAKHILGAQANLWTEYITNPAKVEYMIFPRMLALSEVLWSPKEKRNWNDFERRLPVLFERLDKTKINYSKAYYDLKATVIPSANYKGVLWKLESKNPKDKILYVTGVEDSRFFEYKEPVQPFSSGLTCMAWIAGQRLTMKGNAGTQVQGLTMKSNAVTQQFFFNKATGKKITIVNEASKNYPGDGAFTLVNGVQNEKGLSKNSEFLGFSGADLDVTIDLGAVTEVKKVTLHAFSHTGSWIYLPASVEVQYIVAMDSGSNNRMPPVQFQTKEVKQQRGNVKIELAGTYECRYIRVIAKNIGIIPQGNPGAGEKAWLFADEIEVE